MQSRVTISAVPGTPFAFVFVFTPTNKGTFLLLVVVVKIHKERGQKKNGAADPLPPSPMFGNFHIFYRFMPFYKPLNWKKERKIWSGFGSDPSPPFGNFPHMIPFFSDLVPNAHIFIPYHTISYHSYFFVIKYLWQCCQCQEFSLVLVLVHLLLL